MADVRQDDCGATRVNFGKQKQTLPSPKTKVRGITPGEICEYCIVVGEF